MTPEALDVTVVCMHAVSFVLGATLSPQALMTASQAWAGTGPSEPRAASPEESAWEAGGRSGPDLLSLPFPQHQQIKTQAHLLSTTPQTLNTMPREQNCFQRRISLTVVINSHQNTGGRGQMPCRETSLQPTS